MNSSQSIYLDIVRILSAQIVLVGHLLNYYYGYGNSSPSLLIKDTELYIQSIAVVFFFVLSGMLIGKSVHSMKIRCSGFFEYSIARFSRIYVTLIPCLFIILGIDIINREFTELYAFDNAFTIKSFIGTLLMLQNYSGGLSTEIFGSARPFWSLAIEWWLYLSLGFAFLNKIWDWKSVVMIVLLSYVPIHLLINGSYLPIIFVVAMLIAMYVEKIDFHYCCMLLALGVYIGFNRLLIIKSPYDFMFMLSILLVFISIFYLLSSLNFKIKKSIFITSLSGASYSLYLLHYSIIDLFYNLSRQFEFKFNVLPPYVLSMFISLLTWYYFDRKHKNVSYQISSFFKHVQLKLYKNRYK